MSPLGARKNPPRNVNSAKEVNYCEASDEEDDDYQENNCPKTKRQAVSVKGGNEDRPGWFTGTVDSAIQMLEPLLETVAGGTLRETLHRQKNTSMASSKKSKAKGSDDDDDDDDEDFDVLDEYRQNVRQLLSENADSLRIVSVVENEHSQAGTPLYNRFIDAWMSVKDSTVKLCFHGTAEVNIEAICREGLDPAKRNGQAFGPGEYFAVDASISLPYCAGGKKMLVVAILMDESGLTKDNGSVVVVHKPEHQLPLFVVTFESS